MTLYNQDGENITSKEIGYGYILAGPGEEFSGRYFDLYMYHFHVLCQKFVLFSDLISLTV
jgi:hypothetical protein